MSPITQRDVDYELDDDIDEAFRARIQELRVPEAHADRENLMLGLGAALAVIGLLFVAAGYWGASGTALVAEQIPYAISGAAGGLAMTVIGTALLTRFTLARLFRFWLARTIHEHQAQTDRVVAAIESLEKTIINATKS